VPSPPHKLSLSQRMARIKKVDTRPELLVRRLVHRHGFRYRLHVRELPGVPDLVFPRLRRVIFVHGCFWHRHDCRDGRKLPSGNHDYWIPKLARNVERDAKHLKLLHAQGWDVLIVWECQLKRQDELIYRLLAFLSGRPRT
jgi:DNA mismatch endonuclease (patch repair protein)